MHVSTTGAPARADDAHSEIARLHEVIATLERQLDESRGEHRRACEQLVAANQGSADTLKLSVALCRLYESEDCESALAGVREIVINVLGSESFAVFTVDHASDSLTPLTSMGVDSDLLARDASQAGIVRDTARTGRRHIGTGSLGKPGRSGTRELVACVPLALGHSIEGVLVIHDLLGHKPALEPFDVDILHLLTTHAMSALRVAALRAGPAA